MKVICGSVIKEYNSVQTPPRISATMREYLLLASLCMASAFQSTPVSFFTEEQVVYTTVRRIGSFPGQEEVKFEIYPDEDVVNVTGVPSRYSETVHEYDDHNNIYEDTFYFQKSFASIRFQGKAINNVLGLHSSSDIWNQFTWMEVCPDQEKTDLLHRTGDPSSLKEHVCGYGAEKIMTITCESLTDNNCVLPDNPNVQLEWFGRAQREDSSLALANFPQSVQPIEDPDDPNEKQRMSAKKAGVYGIFVPSATRLDIYPEYVAVHTHSYLSLLLIESLLIFYLHFVSDKDKNFETCKWTYMPTYTGTIVAILSMATVKSHFSLEDRIYHGSTFFRDNNTTVSILSITAVLLSAIFVHILISIPQGEQKQFWKIHVMILYELILQIPATFILMGGGQFNLMNLLFTFLVTLVVIASRIRDAISLFFCLRGGIMKNASAKSWTSQCLLVYWSCLPLVSTSLLSCPMFGFRVWKIYSCFLPSSTLPLVAFSPSSLCVSGGLL